MAPTRKKLSRKDEWARNRKKKERHRSKHLPALPACSHPKKKFFCCQKLTMQDVRRFHQDFYRTSNKIEQDNFILKHTTQTIPKRPRKRESTIDAKKQSNRKNGVWINYVVKTRLDGLIPVCAKTFLGILGISKFRVQNISKKYLVDGHTPTERRGGDYKSVKFAPIREAIKNFLQALQFVESHYTREKSSRHYLPSDSTAKDLWRAYNSSVAPEMQAKYWLFMRVFNYDFNISFKSPATDACSECIRLKSLIKSLPSGNLKEDAMARLTVHKMKAKAFYNLLKMEEDPTVLKVSFDCQKNQVLPRVPDQAAYYSRQLYVYNFTICEGSSTAVQNAQSVFIYTWLEHERLKGSNEISSILYYHLKTRDLSGIKEIEVFCDGCPGQNKNITVIGMLCKFLSETSTCQKISITFPVVGHSFLPADRIFGRIEKKIKKKDTITNPQEYFDLFSQSGTVRRVGSEVPVFDWKTAVAPVIKTPAQLHFKFAPSKRILLRQGARGLVTVQGEVNYRVDLGAAKGILKKGKRLNQISPQPLPNTVNVKPEKLRDVDNLLKKHFGEDWRSIKSLMYYRRVLDEGSWADEEDNTSHDEEDNIIIEEDGDLMI